jgi:hypothetical protein
MRVPDPFETVIWAGLIVLVGLVGWAILWFGWLHEHAAFN